MAEKSKSGTYIKVLFNVWYDKKANNIHLTTRDPDIPGNGAHLTAKRDTQSDVNLRYALTMFGCMTDPTFDTGNVDVDAVVAAMGYLPMKKH